MIFADFLYLMTKHIMFWHAPDVRYMRIYPNALDFYRSYLICGTEMTHVEVYSVVFL